MLPGILAVVMARLTQLLVILAKQFDGLSLPCLPVVSCSRDYYMHMWVIRILVVGGIPTQLLALHLLQIGHHISRPLPPVQNRFILRWRQHDFVIAHARTVVFHNIVHRSLTIDGISVLVKQPTIITQLARQVAWSMLDILEVGIEVGGRGLAVSSTHIFSLRDHGFVLHIRIVLIGSTPGGCRIDP